MGTVDGRYEEGGRPALPRAQAQIPSNGQAQESISALAASAHISTSECLRCFRTLAGSTPMRYVGEVRLSKARELLTVAEVAARCGYQNPGHFARMFKRNWSVTPMAFHKRGRAP